MYRTELIQHQMQREFREQLSADIECMRAHVKTQAAGCVTVLSTSNMTTMCTAFVDVL